MNKISKIMEKQILSDLKSKLNKVLINQEISKKYKTIYTNKQELKANKYTNKQNLKESCKRFCSKKK